MAKGYKTGGRQKGTPNKNNPIKVFLKEHSLSYFQPGEDGLSQFERDLAELEAPDRVAAELKMLKFHTPEMKATDITASVEQKMTIEDKLRKLAGEDNEEE